MVKKNVNFQAEEDTSNEFDAVLKEYEEVTGISLKKGNCLEIAMKDYVIKLRKQIELLKQG
ncbi:hypothetical protein [uncultured Draconibacterium sp.]|uniref:hypothetical protein n=1 Tax=uncultured Draconibacterium sp. TaxID=1573823 RepID=UPI0025FC8FC5|nr:hypothetical protein [uncultured Draconibacterium sp.]